MTSTQKLIMTGLTLISLTSCGVVQRAVGFGGNPKPNMKTIHMSTIHSGYTQEHYEAHPEWDCQTYKPKNKKQNEQQRNYHDTYLLQRRNIRL